MSNNLPSANLALDACLKTVAENILSADQALALFRAIGTNAEAINAANWGHAFFALQVSLADQFVVSTARIFEPPSSKYPIHSLRTAASSLHDAPGTFRIVNRDAILRYLPPSVIAGREEVATDQEITALVATSLLNDLPDHRREIVQEHDSILDAIKTRRDKVIAHSEGINKAALPSWTWQDGIALLELAKRLTGIVSRGYTTVIYTGDAGDFLLSSDALRTVRSLERFLKQAMSAQDKPGAS